MGYESDDLATGVANIPDAMASAVLAGANPVRGLYAIMIGTPLGALVGSSAFMNVATTSALATTEHAGLLKVGRLLRFVANSAVIGFLTGAENVFEATTTSAPAHGRPMGLRSAGSRK